MIHKTLTKFPVIFIKVSTSAYQVEGANLALI